MKGFMKFAGIVLLTALVVLCVTEVGKLNVRADEPCESVGYLLFPSDSEGAWKYILVADDEEECQPGTIIHAGTCLDVYPGPEGMSINITLDGQAVQLQEEQSEYSKQASFSRDVKYVRIDSSNDTFTLVLESVIDSLDARLTTDPDSIIEGYELKAGDFKVYGVYSDDSKVELNSDKYNLGLSNVNKDLAGEYDVHISLKSDSRISKDVKVTIKAAPAKDPEIESLEVTVKNSDAIYAGCRLGYNDFVVKAVFSDNTKVKLKSTDYGLDFSKINTDEVGEYTVGFILNSNNNIRKEVKITVKPASEKKEEVTPSASNKDDDDDDDDDEDEDEDELFKSHVSSVDEYANQIREEINRNREIQMRNEEATYGSNSYVAKQNEVQTSIESASRVAQTLSVEQKAVLKTVGVDVKLGACTSLSNNVVATLSQNNAIPYNMNFYWNGMDITIQVPAKSTLNDLMDENGAIQTWKLAQKYGVKSAVKASNSKINDPIEEMKSKSKVVVRK